MVGEAAVTDLAGDFMVASPVTVLAGHSVWEGTQQWSLILQGHPDSLADLDLMMGLCVRAAAMTLRFCVMMMAVSGIATLGAMRISDITTTVSFAIMAIFSTILISLRSVSLIGGTLTTGTSATDIRMTNIPTSMRIMIPHRFTMTSIGKIWRGKYNRRFPGGATTMARLTE